jgi:diaminopimelate decarboxylase
LNAGGGLGVDYHHPDTNAISDFQSYFKVFKDFLNVRADQEVHFELGRALVAQCASLVSKVLYVKNGQKKNFLVLDAGMTELIRPMLYQAYHEIENVSRSGAVDLKYDVVGPICESTDCFRKDVELPESFRGDLIAVRTAGAYGEVMASGYNLRDRVKSVYSE